MIVYDNPKFDCLKRTERAMTLGACLQSRRAVRQGAEQGDSYPVSHTVIIGAYQYEKGQTL